METQDKTAVQLVQDLIAIHITRKEASKRLFDIVKKDGETAASAGMQRAEKQSQAFLPALLDELSSYGDAVAADANRNGDYITGWNNTLGNIDNLTPEDAAAVFKELEKYLRTAYDNLLDPSNELPPSFLQIIEQQRQQLKATEQ